MRLHTPGPWEFHEQGDANFYAITHFKDRRKSVDWLLSLQHNGEQLDFEQKANMLLIAAAPDLLDALQLLVQAVEFTPLGVRGIQAVAHAKEIVAKATGE